MKRLLSLALLLLLLPLPRASAEEMTLSILGDSISTYEGYSDDASANTTIGNSRLYYPRRGNRVSAEDTWWYQTAQLLGLRLLVNNSWSGSCVLESVYGTEGAYVSRCVQLHSNQGEDPDIIAVYLGANDYYGFPDTVGSYGAIDFDALISPEGCAKPKTALEAYAVMLHKILSRYPDAQVYCFTQLPLGGYYGEPVEFNADIRRLADHFGCETVDLFNCGIVPQVHMGDALHPERAGMDAITAAFAAAILQKNDFPRHAVTYDLTEVASTGGTAACVMADKPFSTDLIPLTGPYLDVTVTMDGVDITAYCVRGGSICVARVVGDLTVTAEPSDTPMEKRADMKAALGGMLLGAAAKVK